MKNVTTITTITRTEITLSEEDLERMIRQVYNLPANAYIQFEYGQTFDGATIKYESQKTEEV